MLEVSCSLISFSSQADSNGQNSQVDSNNQAKSIVKPIVKQRKQLKSFKLCNASRDDHLDDKHTSRVPNCLERFNKLRRD